MKVKTENGREIVEYEDGRGRRIYTGAERFIDEDEDFSDRIPADNLPESAKIGLSKGKQSSYDNKQGPPEEVKGVGGFKKLPNDRKKDYLRNKIPGLTE